MASDAASRSAAGRTAPGEGFAAGLALHLRALRHPRRTAKAGEEIVALAKEFAAGGVVVEGRGLTTTVQADGDVQVRVFGDFPAAAGGAPRELLDAHFREIERRLRPMTRAREVVALVRGATGSLATATGGVTEVLRAVYGELTSIAFWLPHLLTLVLALMAILAPRVIWWLVRYELRKWQRTPEADVQSGGQQGDR